MVKKPYRRSLLFHINDFQKRLIFPVLLSCLFSQVCITYLYCYSYNDQYYFLKMALPWILISLAFLFIILWTYYVSNKIVGPFERVLREVDDILAGKGEKKISTRKGDVMFEELVKRINALVERQSKTSGMISKDLPAGTLPDRSTPPQTTSHLY